MSNSDVTSGPPQSGLVVSSSNLFVYSGGLVVSTQIEQGGTATIYFGGTASNTFAASGGVEIISSGGASFATSVIGDSLAKVFFGGEATSTTVTDGSSEFVFSGGVTTSATVGSGGQEVVSAGGTASGASVQGGELLVYGTAAGALIITGTMTVGAGGVAADTVVSARELSSGYYASYSGGEVVVLSGASVDDTILAGAGPAFINMIVSAGATVDDVIVSGGMMLLSGGSANDITIAGNGTLNAAAHGGVNIYSGGTAANISIESGGFLDVDAGAMTSAITVAAGGAENVFAGIADETVISSGGQQYIGSGTVRQATIYDGGLQIFAGTGTATDTILQSGATEIFNGNSGKASDTGIYAGATIDLSNLLYSGAGTASVDLNDLLTISEGGMTFSEQLYGDYTNASFPLSGDAGSGTKVVATGAIVIAGVPCFCTGTVIELKIGNCAVEKLVVGDHVRTVFGDSRPVLWIGRRCITTTRHRNPDLVWPVRVKKDAFAAGRPIRDLFLSPDHAVFANGVLIPIKHLINGASIAQIPVDDVTYWHVELDRHDILLAEGLACESYLDTDNRSAFGNGDWAVQLHPDFRPSCWDDACAELVQEGPRLVAVKQRLFNRASIQSAPPTRALRVLAEQLELVPEILAPGVWRFAIPPATRTLQLVSSPWVPAEHDAASLDRRTLGVRLFGVTVDCTTIVLDGPALFSGFHPTEHTAEGACRWTTGDARLVLPVGGDVVTLYVGEAVIPEPARLAPAA